MKSPDDETRDERRARVLAGLRLMVHESEQANFDAWTEHVEKSRLASHCEHSEDAADFSLTIGSAVTEGLNIVCAEGEQSERRTAEIFNVLAQTMGYEFARRLRQSIKEESAADPLARIDLFARHGNAFVQGMQQCFATMSMMVAERPN